MPDGGRGLAGVSVLYLVRHGQASFGAAEYDRLSPIGERQCELLAEHWAAIGRDVDFVYTGRLRRHRQSAAAFQRARAAAGQPAREVRSIENLAEYDYLSLLQAHARTLPEPLDWQRLGSDPKAFDRVLTAALERWIAGTFGDVEPYEVFRHRCGTVIHDVMAEVGRGATAVVFGSAGSIGAGIQSLLGLSDMAAMRLKLTFHNSSVTRILFDGRRSTVESINVIAHLEKPGLIEFVTHR